MDVSGDGQLSLLELQSAILGQNMAVRVQQDYVEAFVRELEV